MVMVKKQPHLQMENWVQFPDKIAQAIVKACDAILIDGKCMDQFPSDVYQGGAGTLRKYEYQRSGR